ncbi:MAG: pilus assembly protein [Planctomycetes bacterium]|nr:pilus assembly protein [Planctomycetota bacterium]
MNNYSSRKRSTKRGQRRGAAVIEFAVVAPLFLLLLAGIIEFGQAFRIEHMLSNAARRGTRSAIVHGATSSEVEQKVKTQCMRTIGVDEEGVTVRITVNGIDSEIELAEEGDEISITVSVEYSEAGTGFFASFLSSATLSATCTMEHE